MTEIVPFLILLMKAFYLVLFYISHNYREALSCLERIRKFR